MPDDRFARLVELACHDLRTPLATVSGFAKTLARTEVLAEREERFVTMIDQAADHLAALVDLLGQAARVEAGRYDPPLAAADTLELAAAGAAGEVTVEGTGTAIETNADAISKALELLASAALRFGEVPTVSWAVHGRELVLSPLTPAAAPVVAGETFRDLGALVARITIEALGGTLTFEDGTLRVAL